MGNNNGIRKASKYLGSATALAEKLGVNRSTITNWATGRRPVPVKRCVEIERATKGAVTRKDLRPDDWHEIWPELK